MINKILVATDASEAANRAVQQAIFLAVQNNAELLVVNVIRDMQLPRELRDDPQYEAFYSTREDLMRQVADKILAQAETAAREQGVAEVKTAIGSGDPATSIAGFARRRKFDLIVIGTRGVGEEKCGPMGSVSRKLLESTEVNCLVVR